MTIGRTRIPRSQVWGVVFSDSPGATTGLLMAFGAPNHLIQAGIYSTILSLEDGPARKMYLALRMARIGGA